MTQPDKDRTHDSELTAHIQSLADYSWLHRSKHGGSRPRSLPRQLQPSIRQRHIWRIVPRHGLINAFGSPLLSAGGLLRD